jgi:membrane-bound serine protease (ClpP class)
VISKMFLILSLALSSSMAAVPRDVWLLEVAGPIGPATADYVVNTLAAAEDAAAELVVLQMNTPGGLDRAMRDIIQAILAAQVPVVTYVAPQGSRAASAGTYILYASHLAAMAPATNLGAATPIMIGGLPKLPGSEPESPERGDDSQQDGQSQPLSPEATMHSKMVNDAQAYIRSLAELRGRNAEWAVEAVKDAATLTAQEALELNVIDLVAKDTPALLEALDGRTVLVDGQPRVLDLAGANLHAVAPGWRTEFLRVVTNPSVAYLLLLVGIYGLIFEFSSPGMGAGGIIGGICLLIALYAMQLLPISYSALALMLLGLGLMAAEALSPSFGVLGIGGIAAFMIGSIMLMDADVPGFRIALPVILALTTVSVGVLILVLNLLLRARKQPVVSGSSTLVGETADVVDSVGDDVHVCLHGEIWRVDCPNPLQTGDRVRIKKVSGLLLDVEKKD